MFKRISAVGVSCVTALVLMLSAIASPSTAFAATLEEMTGVAIECIVSHEGSYGSINPNDCGAVSVGKLQWHANRALSVMRRACQLNPSFAEATLGSSLYNDVMSAGSWSYRTFSSSEAKAAAALLSSDYGIQAQDAQAYEDVQSYIVTGQNKGITDAGALVLYADIYNFGCGIAASVASKAASYAGSYGAVTLDDMYKAALNCSYSSNSAFVSRADMVYSYLCSIGYGGTAADNTQGTTTTTTPAVQFTEDGAGTYTVTASLLNLRSGPGTGYSIVTTIPNGASVTVTATGGGWAAVEYSGLSGYCSMEYLSICAETTTETTETEVTETTTETTAVSTETTTETTTETKSTETTTASETEATTTTTTTEITYETEVSEETTVTAEVTGTTTAESRTDVIVNSAYASIYGDINCDGVVSVADAVLLHKYIVGAVSLNVEQIANADCSFDGILSTKDVTVIMQHLSGHYTALPIL